MPKAWKMVPQSDFPMGDHFSGSLVDFQSKLRWNRPKTKKTHISVWPKVICCPINIISPLNPTRLVQHPNPQVWTQNDIWVLWLFICLLSQDSSNQTENRSQSARLQVLVDFKTFVSRLLCGVVTTAFITIMYYESSPDDLVKFPGYLFVYAYYFVMLPIMQISQRYLHIIGHPTLKDHLRRRIRDNFTSN